VRDGLEGARLLHRRRRAVRPARAREAVAGVLARGRLRQRLQDLAQRPAAPDRGRPRLPLVREARFRAAAARRRLRLPPDAAQRVRQGAADALVRRDLRRADEEGAGPRLQARRGSGAPLPQELRQEPVLQLPAGGAHAAGPSAALVRSRGEAAPPRARNRARRSARSAPVSDHRDYYRGRKVLVTGGLGFIGSNLCRTLADLGAVVTAVDSLLPDYGGNLFNLDGYEQKLRINIADVRGHGMEYLVRGHEVLFNLAGQVSHIDSMTDPVTDLEINCTSQLRLLEAVRRGNPELRVVYAGTRQVYGRPLYLPVDEKHLLQPVDVNGINKISGEFYHLVYHQVYGISTSSLRLTNTYGPRQLIRHNRQGFIGWFVRQAALGEEIQIFGDGSQKRDFNHVDDVTDAFLRAGASDAA